MFLRLPITVDSGPALNHSDRDGLMGFNAELLSVSKLLDRLQYRVDRSWPRRLYQWRIKFLQSFEPPMPPSLSLVDFVGKSSLVVRSAICFFGDCFDQSSKSKNKKERNRQSTVSNVHHNKSPRHLSANDPSAKCKFCDSTQHHPPWHCRRLKEMNVKE